MSDNDPTRGERGPTGDTGQSGDIGATGKQGLQGVIGVGMIGERGQTGDHGQTGESGARGIQGERGPAATPRWYSLTDTKLLIIFVLTVSVSLVGFTMIQHNTDKIKVNAYNACVSSANIIKLLNKDTPEAERIAVPVCRRP